MRALWIVALASCFCIAAVWLALYARGTWHVLDLPISVSSRQLLELDPKAEITVRVDRESCRGRNLPKAKMGSSFDAYLASVFSSFVIDDRIFFNQNEYTFGAVLCATAYYQLVHTTAVFPVRFVFGDAVAELSVSEVLIQGMVVSSGSRSESSWLQPSTWLRPTTSCPQLFDCGGFGTIGQCSTPMPFVTGIYSPAPHPHSARAYLLTYVGSSWRNGNRRGALVRGLIDMRETKQFVNLTLPLVIANPEEEKADGWLAGNISRTAKAAYMSSVFSLQPGGDNLFRRAFYEAVLLGNIPIVSAESFGAFKYVLGEEIMQQITVVLPDADFWDARRVVEHLQAMSPSRVAEMQANIAKFARYMAYDADETSYWQVLALRIGAYFNAERRAERERQADRVQRFSIMAVVCAGFAAALLLGYVGKSVGCRKRRELLIERQVSGDTSMAQKSTQEEEELRALGVVVEGE